jgi:putative radical SAM enzyme (TIGR03279 family)
LVAINGHVLRDVIDYYFHAADERLELEIERAGTRLALAVERGYGEGLGVRFTDDVFDGIRRCNNRCSFCFVDQLPPGLRPSLYVKDDDYRYSFLHGNFITLSNWTEEVWERVAEQQLSPLYISVHTTNPDRRNQLLSNPDAPDIGQQLRRLAGMGIEAHTQIVVMPNLNDGEQLEQTVRDLTSLFPAVASIGVVPVGLTKYHTGDIRLLTPEEERAIVDSVIGWQRENRRELGVGLVYPSDELYLRTGRSVPPAEEYDGFPQLENGIGLVRQLLDEWETLRREWARPPLSGRASLVCGTLIAPTMGRICHELPKVTGVDLNTVPVTNELLGSTVTVSGLLAGQDVGYGLQGRDSGAAVFAPKAMFGSEGQVTLDGMTAGDIEAVLRVPVVVTDGIKALLEYLGGAGASCDRRSVAL